MQKFLPSEFYFSGVASKGVPARESGAPDPLDASASSDAGGPAGGGALPLEAEAHWRLYQNAAFLRGHLKEMCAVEGFNLQDFMFHV